MTTSSQQPENTPTPADALEWTAFLYSVDELSDAESARFEERLESEPAAQAALAEVVALSAGVRLAERSATVPFVQVQGHSYRRRAAGWVLLATAASIALWFSVAQLRLPNAANTVLVPGGETQSELALAWLDGQPNEEDLAIDEDAREQELLAEWEAHPVMEEPSAPDWLLAALADAPSLPVRGEN